MIWPEEHLIIYDMTDEQRKDYCQTYSSMTFAFIGIPTFALIIISVFFG